MRLLFDLLSAQPSGTSQFHGGGEYVKRVFKCIVEEFSTNLSIEVYFDKSKYLDAWIIDIIETNSIVCHNITQKSEVTSLIENGNYDVFYSGIPYDYNFIDFPKETLAIGTIHGLRTLEKATDMYSTKYVAGKKLFEDIKTKAFYGIRHYRNKEYNKKTIEKFDKFICDSEHTKYSLINFFPTLNPDNIYVYYAPLKEVDYNGEFDEEITKKYGKYILILGCDRWIKNSYRAILAINSLIAEDRLKDYNIVLVGKITKKIEKTIKGKKQYHNIDYVDKGYLEGLYKNCDFLFYPSLNEGFGLPPVEAMKYGKTVIASGVCSIPEVCADAVYYVNPYDLKEMRNRLLMASYEKLPIERVRSRYSFIYNKQEKDLREICKFIVCK